MIRDLFDKLKSSKYSLARCGGKGYFILPPKDPTNWDVDLVRVECKGCSDCADSKEKARMPCTMK